MVKGSEDRFTLTSVARRLQRMAAGYFG
jgi:hypothetical protein